LKNYQIEVQRFKRMSHVKGLIEAEIDVLVLPLATRGDAAASTVLSMSEETARVLQLLLKAQLAELDRRKARSQR
jgi:hypothetical protein